MRGVRETEGLAAQGVLEEKRGSDLLEAWAQLSQHIAIYKARRKEVPQPAEPLDEKLETSSSIHGELVSQPLAHELYSADEDHAENVSEHVPELAFERPAPAMSNPEQGT